MDTTKPYKSYNASINEGYEVPIEHQYAEIYAQSNNTKYDYINEQNVPMQTMQRDTSTEPAANQGYETLQHRKTSQPGCIKRHKIMFAVILSIVLTALISAIVFVIVFIVMKSDEDSGKYIEWYSITGSKTLGHTQVVSNSQN